MGDDARTYHGPKLTAEQLERVAAEVKRRRTAADLTLAELGQRAGISMQAVGLIETKRSTPTLGTLAALASALKCRAADLIRGI